MCPTFFPCEASLPHAPCFFLCARAPWWARAHGRANTKETARTANNAGTIRHGPNRTYRVVQIGQAVQNAREDKNASVCPVRPVHCARAALFFFACGFLGYQGWHAPGRARAARAQTGPLETVRVGRGDADFGRVRASRICMVQPFWKHVPNQFES